MPPIAPEIDRGDVATFSTNEPAVPPAEAKLRTQWHVEGTSKGGTAGQRFQQKKKSERDKERWGDGGRGARRDDAIHSRDEGGGIHVSPVSPSSLSRSLVSPALGVSTVTVSATCYPLQMRQPRTHP